MSDFFAKVANQVSGSKVAAAKDLQLTRARSGGGGGSGGGTNPPTPKPLRMIAYLEMVKD